MDSRPLLKLHTMSQDLTSKHYAITSEAATLHYLWSKGIPVPKVYGYTSSENNPIGAEYIIMEKASGIGLETRWLGMSKPEQHKLTSSFVETEKKFFDISFGSIRSLYFKTDIPPALQALLYTTNTEDEYDSEKLCIGPTADYMFWHGSRAALHLYHGPCEFTYSLVVWCLIPDYSRDWFQRVPHLDRKQRNQMDSAVWKASRIGLST